MYVVAFSLDDNLTILIEECEKLLKYEDSVNQQQNKIYNLDKRMTNLNANLELCQQKYLKLFYIVLQLSRVFVLNVSHKKPEYIVGNVLIQNTYF
jgi:hypothetical protein